MQTYNILVVEDDVFGLQYMKHILRTLGYKNIFEATNKDEAFNIVQNQTIDLVFMDINIDGSVDGITSAHLLNELYFLPIIFTTAYGDSATISDASDTNIFGYLIKPFELSDVEATLTVALKKIKYVHQSILKVLSPNKFIDLGNNQLYNLTKKTFFIDNMPVDLTNKELNLLDLLCKNINNNVSNETIKTILWENKNISNSTLRDTMSRLRRKVPLLQIENIVNYGYILKGSNTFSSTNLA
ncbi:response regulator [Candidatus Sulfurimonas baltica]|uniref:Response regulator n=1 Tax=Candidatus Sulfurimonas baltica TaxID=2740404 RepID=A0A7S7LSX1_9BACT|nr:response regulator [Candidatus Sulfurimonas baltica]QOY50961.1 response regulator [Candidatus Sulfurimonas baltica]